MQRIFTPEPIRMLTATALKRFDDPEIVGLREYLLDLLNDNSTACYEDPDDLARIASAAREIVTRSAAILRTHPHPEAPRWNDGYPGAVARMAALDAERIRAAEALLKLPIVSWPAGDSQTVGDAWRRAREVLEARYAA